ncbi:MAG TPA: PrgI family protein [Patescibacteria group bacterium]|nr:PrgI family protein [Patescibacteria group bacterium]
MENHPIPQDITGFEFKLIGDMTLKQFAYVAGGAIVGLIFYALPIFALIKIPIALIFVGTGVLFAFVPFEGRPLDIMIRNFLRAVLNPTQYIYQKMDAQPLAEASLASVSGGKKQSLSEASQKQLKDFLNSLPVGKNKLDKKEMVFFESLAQYETDKPLQANPGFVASHSIATSKTQLTSAQTVAQQQVTKPAQEEANEELQKTAALLEKELQNAKAKEAAEDKTNPEEYLKAHQKVLELQKNLNDLTFQKQELESKLISLQQKMEMQGKSIYTPSVAHPEELKETKFVRSIPQSMQKSAGLPTAPEFPNVVTGIIKDPRGNPLQNILVEVKDSQGNAVRAFKTNALGQFASATPLVNGEYTIGFEDPREQNKFDTVAFKATGEIILPIEIISVDTREELRRSLFN